MSPSLRDYQRQSVSELHALAGDRHRRATCVLPCGTGKTVVAVEAVRGIDTVVMLVPTVALVEQMVAAWRAADPDRHVIAVCQPHRSTVDVEDDVAVVDFPTTTDADTLAEALTAHPRAVAVATYASAHVAAAAAPTGGWGAAVVDEAHRTAGVDGKPWGLILDDRLFPARRRFFFTATPRQYVPDPDTTDGDGGPVQVASMTNPALYGPLHQPLSTRDAIRDGWLSDYRVAVVAVTSREVRDVLTGHTATSTGEIVDMATAAGQIALSRYAATHPGLSTAMVFTNRVDASRQWADSWEAITRDLPAGARPRGATGCVHIDGTMPPAQRRAALDTLTQVPDGDLRLVSNCRVLAEGVDVPALDAVVFAQPRTSHPDIVQIVGRALRPHPSGPDRKALVVVPVVVDADDYGTDVEDPIATRGFLPVWQVLTALSHEDSALYDGLARARADIDTGRDPRDALADTAQIDLDLDAFPADVAVDVGLRVLRATTTPWATLVARLRDHVHAGGDPNPRAGFCLRDGYPLGQRVRAARAAHAQGRLHPAVERMFQQVPDWSWDATVRTRRGFDEHLALLRQHVATTGVPTVRPYEATTAADGTRVPIGAWVDRQRRRRSLPTDQEQQMAAVLGAGWRRR